MSAVFRVDHASAIRERLTDPRRLCDALGLLQGAVRQAGGLVIRCPAHGDRTPSCSVRVGPDGTIAVHCFACDFGGNALALVAAVYQLELRRDFPQVLEQAAAIAGYPLDDDAPRQPLPPPRVLPRTLPGYPDPVEVAALWDASGPVSSDEQAVAYLADRDLDADVVDLYGLARVLPVGAMVPRWATVGGAWWSNSGHRLLVPTFDATGALRSLRAWRLTGEQPKRVAPLGYSTVGLVMACPVARTMLETGRAPEGREGRVFTVVVTEGEPDFLTWATLISDANEHPPATIGVVSSAWSDGIAARIPSGADVIVLTHQDEAGDRYAAQIQRTLIDRCALFDLVRSSGAARAK